MAPTEPDRTASVAAPDAGGPPADRGRLAERVHFWVLVSMATVMCIDLVVIVADGRWLNGFLVLTIVCVMLSPLVLRGRMPVRVPVAMQLAALTFIFAALFLGEIQSYYDRIWWWDIALHTSSGLLLGILGFLLVYVLNESRTIDVNLRPRFVALFAFLFAVSIGALWEIFEFAVDGWLGTSMQKPMFDDPSGLTDTMWDLIVDTAGALAISGLGWWYMHREAQSFIESWIEDFIRQNPRLFRPARSRSARDRATD